MKLTASFLLLLFGLCLTSCVRASGSYTSISVGEAKRHIGEEEVVSGTVIEIFISRQNTSVYLYLDAGLPNAKFAAVWPGTNDPPIKELKDLIAKPISVKGKITAERGWPEIIVHDGHQITYAGRASALER